MSTTQKRRPEDWSASDDHLDVSDDDIPLHHRRPFGAGLKRKRVEFVRAQEQDVTSAVAVEKAATAAAVGDLYASIVLGTATKAVSSSAKEESSDTLPVKEGKGRAEQVAVPSEEHTEEEKMCLVCSLPITTSLAEHNGSLAHQVSIQHSHPPSHLDRSRMGLKTLNAQGWDPDARVGLGRGGEGVRFPIKVVPKEDTLGIGAVVPKKPAAAVAAGLAKEEEKNKKKSLSKREMKAERKKEKEKAERLQQEIYGRVDVDRYLKG